MSRLKNFQEKLKKKSKYEIIKSLFQAVTATVVSVVAVTVLIPKSPIANFDKIKVFSHEIIYEVNVTDEEFTVEDNTLTLVLENQYVSLSKPISIGNNYGSFSNLEDNTKYNLSVVYNKGFGNEIIAKESIVTKNDLVVAITDVNYQRNEIDELTTLDLSLLYGDVSEYADLSLEYAVDYGYSEELLYETISLIDLPEIVSLEFYYQPSQIEYVFLVSGVKNAQTWIIDEIHYKPPFELNAEVYLGYFNDNEAAFYIYQDSNLDFEVDFRVDLYHGVNQVNSIDYEITSSEQHQHGSPPFLIDKLKPETEYRFVFIATYISPDTLRSQEMIIDEIVVNTLQEPIYEISIIENDNTYDVNVVFYKGDFDYLNYEYYYYDEAYEYYSYYSSNSFDFIVNEEGSSISFTIQKGGHQDFYIEISMMSKSDYHIRKIIERIES